MSHIIFILMHFIICFSISKSFTILTSLNTLPFKLEIFKPVLFFIMTVYLFFLYCFISIFMIILCLLFPHPRVLLSLTLNSCEPPYSCCRLTNTWIASHSFCLLQVFGWPLVSFGNLQQTSCWEEWNTIALQFLLARELQATFFHSSEQRDFCCLLPKLTNGHTNSQQLGVMCPV